MKKQVLIITSRTEQTATWKEREQYVRQFCELVENQLENIEVRFTTYSDLRYTVIAGQTSIVDTLNDTDLKDVQLVHFKNWQYEINQAPVVAAYLRAHGVLYFNSEVHLQFALGKLAQMFLLSAVDVPVPDTFYASKEQLKIMFAADTLPTGFAYPFIMKANDGSRGDDNHLVQSAKEATDILAVSDPETQYVIQNFIVNDGDLRVLFMGLDVDPMVFRRKSMTGSHLNNTSKGGQSTLVDVHDLPPEFLDYARRAAQTLGREIGGVDIIVDKTSGKPYILEVNASPQVASGAFPAEKIENYGIFLKNMLL